MDRVVCKREHAKYSAAVDADGSIPHFRLLVASSDAPGVRPRWRDELLLAGKWVGHLNPGIVERRTGGVEHRVCSPCSLWKFAAAGFLRLTQSG